MFNELWKGLYKKSEKYSSNICAHINTLLRVCYKNPIIELLPVHFYW